MKKNLFFLLMLIASITANSQAGFSIQATNPLDTTLEVYTTLTPTNQPGNRRVTSKTKDSTYWRMDTYRLLWPQYKARNEGTPTSIVWVDSLGNVRKSLLSAIPGLGAAENDPVWNANKTSYYTKTQADARYLQSFTETDPTVPSFVKSILTGDILNWNAAFNWGDHSLAGYLKGIDTVSLSSRINAKLSVETDPLSVHTGDSSSMLINYLRKAQATALYQPIGSYLTSEIDGSVTNELQIISLSNRNLSISNGNTITIRQEDYDSLLHKPTFPSTFRDSVVYYNSLGPIVQKIRTWVGLLTPSTGNGQAVDISSAGFSTIVSVKALGFKNTATATSVPNVAVKSVSTTSVVLNITEGNANLTVIGIVSVLLGVSTQFANVTGLTVYLEVTGY